MSDFVTDRVIDLDGLKKALETIDENMIFTSTLSDILEEHAIGDAGKIVILPIEKEKNNPKLSNAEKKERAEKMEKEAERHAKELGEKVLYKFDGVFSTAVYLGDLNSLIPVSGGFWHHDMAADGYLGGDGFGDYASLDDISEYIFRGKDMSHYPPTYTFDLITAFAYGPLSGKIYQFGNHGFFWEEYGELRGYA